MKKNKINRYKNAQKFLPILISGLLLIVVLSILYINFSYSKNNPVLFERSNPNTPTINYDSTLVTPTVIPIAQQNKLQFIHPQKDFSFQYPKEWYIEVYKRNGFKPWYEVYLADKKDSPKFRVNFMTGGRGSPYYEYETTEEKTIGSHNVYWKTMYKDSKAFQVVASFPDNDFGDKLIGLYIYLPENNHEEFIQQVEDIIASLE